VRKLLFFLLFNTTLTYSQSLIQTWTDRCTGEVKTFSISMTGYTTVVFYDKVKQFTAADVQSGALRIWMEETYYWWSQLSPCSTNQATSTAAQNTASQTASTASSAASNAASSASTPPNTGTNGTSNGTSSTSTGSSSSSNTSSNSNSSSSGSSENSGSGNSSGSSESGSSSGESSGGSSEGGNSEGGSSEEGGSTSKEETTEESKSEEVKEEKKEESKEESKEEKKEEEKKEEEKKEKKEEKKQEEDKKKKEKEKKKLLAPPILSANLAGMSGLDGSLSQVASFGFAQASLTGAETYAANLMIWTNLKQFSLTLSKSTVVFKYDKEVDIILKDPFTGEYVKYGTYRERGSIDYIESVTGGYMYLFGTSVINTGVSRVYMGQKDNFWKGFVGGYAINTMGIIPKGGEGLFTASITVFATKPFNVGRIIVAPMIAYSASPVMFMVEQKEILTTPHGTYIIGSNFDFNLTQRFKANIGITTIGATQPGIPLSYAITIGSRFAF
jgi:hypothetical protein